MAHDISKIRIHNGVPGAFKPKLAISQPGDKFEREADRVAEQVMRMPEPCLTNYEAPELEEEVLGAKPMVQRQACDTAKPDSETLAMAHTVLRASGRRLDPETRAFMEPRFGVDLGRVRIHTDRRAQEVARAVNAKAFSLGNDVVFGKGEYSPHTFEGKKLLGHELTHVIQQAPRQAPIIHRTPADKASCGSEPFLDVEGKQVRDPLGVISKAEDTAKVMLNNAIEKIDVIRKEVERNDRLVKGYTIPKGVIFPAVEDAVRLMSIEPYDKEVWLADGPGTVSVVLERLKAIHGTLGKGMFFFQCLPELISSFCGATMTGSDLCKENVHALGCAGTFKIVLCKDFWFSDEHEQSMTVVHEAAHNYYTDIGDEGRINNAHCYEQLTEILNGNK